MRDKVSEHLDAIRRRIDRDVAEFAGLARAMTYERMDANGLNLVESNLLEAKAALNRALKEVDELRSYLGIPKE